MDLTLELTQGPRPPRGRRERHRGHRREPGEEKIHAEPLVVVAAGPTVAQGGPGSQGTVHSPPRAPHGTGYLGLSGPSSGQGADPTPIVHKTPRFRVASA